MNIPYKVFMYYFLFHRASNIILLYDPCGTKVHDICATGRFCCEGCKYLSDTGCITKALACRISLCEIANNRVRAAAIKMKVVRSLRWKVLGNRMDLFRENCAYMIQYLKWRI